MKKLLETLYITTPESYLFERNGNICISNVYQIIHFLTPFYSKKYSIVTPK